MPGTFHIILKGCVEENALTIATYLKNIALYTYYYFTSEVTQQPRDYTFIDSQVCDVTHTLSLVTRAHRFLSASSSFLVAQYTWWGRGKIGGATLIMTVSGLCCRKTLHDTGRAISLLICTNVQRRKSIHLVSSPV